MSVSGGLCPEPDSFGNDVNLAMALEPDHAIVLKRPSLTAAGAGDRRPSVDPRGIRQLRVEAGRNLNRTFHWLCIRMAIHCAHSSNDAANRKQWLFERAGPRAGNFWLAINRIRMNFFAPIFGVSGRDPSRLSRGSKRPERVWISSMTAPRRASSHRAALHYCMIVRRPRHL